MISFKINGEERSVDGPFGRRLSHVLRDDLGLLGTKVGCDSGDCGACTVLLDGRAVCACLTPVAQVDGCHVETVEGLGSPTPSALQKAFLRHGAAQCGICTPGMLMAAEALLRRDKSPERAAVEEALAGVLCRCTGYQKIIDAVLDVSGEKTIPVLQTSPSVGSRLERVDGGEKVQGRELFGADFVPDRALWIKAIRSPHASATFELGDFDNWANENGVLVFTAEHIPGKNCFGVIERFADQPVMAEKAVRMVGECVALVAGDKELMARLDLSSFPVTWHPMKAVEGGDPACQELVHEARADNELIRGLVQRGNADLALSEAAYVVEGSLVTGHVEHAYIEPEAGAAWMDGDSLNIRAATQAPVLDQETTAKVLGLPFERVRIRPAATGGGFGGKLDLSVEPFVGLVTLLTGRPSQMVYTRRESMSVSTKRHPAVMHAKIGADVDGRLVGMSFDGDFDTGAYASWGPTVAVRVPVHASGPYLLPNYQAKARALHTNGPISGAFRGFGVPQAAALQERLFDQLADQIGMDRLAFRRQNALADNVPTVCGQKLQSVGIGACLEALQPTWDRALREVSAFNATSDLKRRGVGVASCWYGCGNTAMPNPSTIRIGITSEGEICLHQGAMDIGQGANTVITQIAADTLGIPIAQFRLIGPDTAVTPDCGKTSASRQTVISGKAALLAASMLRAQILRLANIGENADIKVSGGILSVSNGETKREILLASLPEDAFGYVLRSEKTYDPPTAALDASGQGAPYAVYGYGAQMAEVEVDMKLGTVKVLKMTAAHDLGKVINPLLAEGQIEGGIAQGLGMALMEEYHSGQTDNLHDYLIPTIGDVPDIVSHLIEVPDSEGPLGAKGIGEHVLIPTAPAILNAIRHATGAEISRLPARPDRVLAAIKSSQT
ncbi:MAG: molybdopterin-dependent oxidoreductase [Shimia sp.]|uniref:molybdopterin-dependent oxidoreductase n=1 Tax=Shimia sp. TaxID=1954381 RepID=UPI001B2D511E|nr:molybdopterin cofactor-binding domain-containing protein [Shimia sp.]MBO6897871.1 molybdopterin-dependent oxidoreductase [Shimia sp.]